MVRSGKCEQNGCTYVGTEHEFYTVSVFASVIVGGYNLSKTGIIINCVVFFCGHICPSNWMGNDVVLRLLARCSKFISVHKISSSFQFAEQLNRDIVKIILKLVLADTLAL